MGFNMFDPENTTPQNEVTAFGAITQINSQEFIIPVNGSGFVTDEEWNPFQIYYTTNNCTGTAYLATLFTFVGSQQFPGTTQPLVLSAMPDGSQDAWVFSDVLYYPAIDQMGGPHYDVQAFGSVLINVQPNNGKFSGTCQALTGSNEFAAGPLTSVDLTTIGFTPPFEIPFTSTVGF